MNQLTANDIGFQELTVAEIDEVSGGILCVLCICFGAGFAVGTGIYRAVAY